MEGEHFAGAGLGIAIIGKMREDAGAFINKVQRRVVEIFQLADGISRRLFLDGGQFVAFFLSLGLNDADRLLVHEQNVISWTDAGLIFTHRDAAVGEQIDLLLVLKVPAAGRQLTVNIVPRFLFRVLIHHVTPHRIIENHLIFFFLPLPFPCLARKIFLARFRLSLRLRHLPVFAENFPPRKILLSA